MDAAQRKRKIDEHLEAIRSLESEAARQEAAAWPPQGNYPLWHLIFGMMLGTLGAVVSLGANMLGAPLFGQKPLQLIRVYLTFPMGERALAMDDGTVLFTGCVLYLITGALYGLFIHYLLSNYYPNASRGRRLLIGGGVGLALWIFNFYLILSWLQPLLLGGNWIVRLVPVWVGALTHLAFGLTVAIAEDFGWGRFEPYRHAD